MLVQVRDGSSAQNLDAMLPLLASGAIDDAWCLVTDDIFANDLLREGHIDGMLRRLVAGGVDSAVAVRHATLVPARHFGLRDRGAVAPGYRADLAIVADLRHFQVQAVIKNGRVVAVDGRAIGDEPAPELHHENSVHLPPLDESSFRLPLGSDSPCVIEVVPDQIVTRRATRRVKRAHGCWEFDPAHDVALIASIERHRGTGRMGLALVGGLGLAAPGALGSSVAHDSHNLIVAGTNPRDMLIAARALGEHGGGFVVASDGSVRAVLPLPVAGLLSIEDADTVCRQLAEVNRAARVLGCELQAPFGTLSFLALPVIPELRITTRGLFDVQEQRFVSL
jgi:adenine deaminase